MIDKPLQLMIQSKPKLRAREWVISFQGVECTGYADFAKYTQYVEPETVFAPQTTTCVKGVGNVTITLMKSNTANDTVLPELAFPEEFELDPKDWVFEDEPLPVRTFDEALW